MKNILPGKIPIFPLSGVIFFPNTNLPLNIFENRYLDLVNDCMKKDKYMGMIQLKNDALQAYDVGCLGKIDGFQKNPDGRILINLKGVTRFEIINEAQSKKLYREFFIKYEKFSNDITDNDENLIINEILMAQLMKNVKHFFENNGLKLNWTEFDTLDKAQQIKTIAMIAPISNGEKQKLLETISLNNKIEVMLDIIKFYLHNNNLNNSTIQ